jgi:hypothetical protein
MSYQAAACAGLSLLISVVNDINVESPFSCLSFFPDRLVEEMETAYIVLKAKVTNTGKE